MNGRNFRDKTVEIFMMTGPVRNFEYIKSPVELNSLFSKFFCYITRFITLLDATVDDLQTRSLHKIFFFLWNINLTV